MGIQRAKRLLFTGDLIDGSTAADWGLALEAVPRDELDEVTRPSLHLHTHTHTHNKHVHALTSP